MDGFLVLFLVMSLSFCLGNSLKNSLDDPKAIKEGMNEKSLLNREISKLLEERTTGSDTPDSCFKYGHSSDYKGTVSTTVGGRTCQHWNTNTPHETYHTPPGDDYTSNNCRDLGDNEIPWCYTTDPLVRWENCPVPICDCFKLDKSDEYKGPKSTTISGRSCQYWYSDYTHTRSYNPDRDTNPELFRSNFCLDPSNTGAPWCYTTDPYVRWEFCDVPIC